MQKSASARLKQARTQFARLFVTPSLQDVDYADVSRGGRLPVLPICRRKQEAVILGEIDRDIVSARRVRHIDVDAGAAGNKRPPVICVGLWARVRVQTNLKLIDTTWTPGVVDRVVKCHGHWIRA